MNNQSQSPNPIAESARYKFTYHCPHGHFLYELPYINKPDLALRVMLQQGGDRTFCEKCNQYFSPNDLRETIPESMKPN